MKIAVLPFIIAVVAGFIALFVFMDRAAPWNLIGIYWVLVTCYWIFRSVR